MWTVGRGCDCRSVGVSVVVVVVGCGGSRRGLAGVRPSGVLAGWRKSRKRSPEPAGRTATSAENHMENAAARPSGHP
jgi:hypothetical protein